MKKFYFGFTLAEVLITLGIIGIVAAMTMPTLIQHFQKKALETQLQKFYSMMSQAIKQYMAAYGVDDLRNTPLASDNYQSGESEEALNSINDFAIKYLKVIKECTDEECGTKLSGDNRKWPFNSYKGKKYVLSNGIIIKLDYGSGETDYPQPIEVFVDINGEKGPNKIGYDMQTMSIFYDGSIDESGVTPECRKDSSKCDYYYTGGNTPSEIRESRFQNFIESQGYFVGTFGHLLENGFKFDY